MSEFILTILLLFWQTVKEVLFIKAINYIANLQIQCFADQDMYSPPCFHSGTATYLSLQHMKQNRSALSSALNLSVNGSVKLITSVNCCFRDYCLCMSTDFAIILYQALND